MESENFAAEICGEIARSSSEYKLSQTEFFQLLESAGDTTTQLSEAEFKRYDNVYRKDLPLDRQNTRECKTKMAPLSLNFCRHDQCQSECNFEGNANNIKVENYHKNVQRCLGSKSAECKVKCRLGGTSFSACEQRCSGGNNSQWQLACEARNARDKPLARDDLQVRKNRCLARCDNAYLQN